MTLRQDRRVRNCANILNEFDLLAKLTEGDMVTLECMHHKRCLCTFHRKASPLKSNDCEKDKSDDVLDDIPLSEIINYIRKTFNFTNTFHPVFFLTCLCIHIKDIVI